MSLLEVLEDCARRGIELRAAGEDLRVSAPAGAMTTALREQLRQYKIELVDHLKKVPSAPRGSIGPAPPGANTSRLSVAQRSLWFLHELDPASLAAYSVRQAIRIDGDLVPTRWQTALDLAVQRHDSLRTSFERVAGHPAVRINAALRLPMRHVDLCGLPPPARERALTSLMAEDGRLPFNLGEPPLLRSTLVRLGETHWLFLISAHHLIADAWSAGLVLRETVSLYAGTPLPSPRLQYADAVHWEAERLDSAELDRDLAYWRGRLGDVSLVRLPTDRPPPNRAAYDGASEAEELPNELTRSLADIARQEGVTMFSIMLAAYGLLLHRYTGADDLSIGTSVVGRQQGELEDIVGFFANLIVLRLNMSGRPTFRELLVRVHHEVLDGFAHQEAPFDAVVKAVRPDRVVGQNPLFRVLFLFLRSEVERFSSSNLRFCAQQVPSVTSKFDLSLHVEQTAAGWRCLIEYKTSLFRRETIRQMLDGWLLILSALVRDAGVAVSELPITTSAVHAELLHRRNEIACVPIAHPTLHGWFADVARQHADRIALADSSACMSYAELDRRSNRLAQSLMARGVGREDLVALYIGRSCEMVVAILAILKSGGAYVPLDPTDPKARRTAMLAATRVAVVVTTSALAGELDFAGAQLVLVDETLSAAVALRPSVEVKAANAAYVIHTSGSTGQPRGVVVSHGNVTRLMAATQAWFGFDQDDVWTLFHSVAFDFSVWEMWGALLYGGRLIIVPQLTSRAPEQFLEMLVSDGVTVLNQTPSAFRSLIKGSGQAERVGALRLRTIIFGGEALDPSMLGPWFDAHGDRRPALFNMYGITETTVHVTRRPILDQDARGSSRSLIGERIPDLRVYILDEELQPVPENVVGEVYVGGAGLSRGYLGLPGGTAERFLPDPHALNSGARLYRTGDLACWRANTEIEYIGRADRQVKVRGFRIEPGEIEAVLATHRHVRDCVVVAREQSPGRRQLVAYYLSAAGAATAAELRALCEKLLAPHMVPAAFVQLEAWPLTRNGKLDRAALPAPSEESCASAAEQDSPRTSTELAVARVWQQVLGIKSVGRSDDFFALGGDSMLILDVIARLRAAGFEASAATLYQHKRVADLAHALDAAGMVSADDTGRRAPKGSITEPFALLSIRDRARIPFGVVDAYPLSQLQAGMLFEEQLNPDDALYRDVFSFHVRLPLDVDAWQAEVARALAEHDVLRTSLSLANFEEPLQLVHEVATLRCIHEDANSLSESEQEERILQVVDEMQSTPYDFGNPPFLRFHLVRRAPDRMQIVLGFHHVILDGWSVATLMTQLLSDYAARRLGHGSPSRQRPPVVFRERIVLEREALAATEHEEFWRTEAQRLLPSRLPRLALADGDEGGGRDILHVPVPVTAAVAAGLRELAAEAGVPLKSILLAAHSLVFSFLTGKDEVTTGLIINSRPEREGGERALGLFLATLPLRLSIGSLRHSYIELARKTFAAERRLLAHRWYPLAAIKRLAGGRTLFDAVFNFVHYHVYEAITRNGGVEVLGYRLFERTEFPFIVQAIVLPKSNALQLVLVADTTLFPVAELERISGYYARCLEAMACRTQEPWEGAGES